MGQAGSAEIVKMPPYQRGFQIETLLDASDWFEEVTGLSEAEWMKRRSEFIECGPPVDGCAEFGPHLFVRHVEDQKRIWDAGAFRVWSLSELEDAVERLSQQGTESDAGECNFEIHIRTSNDYRPVEVSHLQADCCRPDNSELEPTMFQVASNFNCCENASHRTVVDRGDFVTHLMADSTQGPAAASGAGKVPFLTIDASVAVTDRHTLTSRGCCHHENPRRIL